MIPSIVGAMMLNDEVWLVTVECGEEVPMPRYVPTTETPKVCPGGPMWCAQFGCELGVNNFTRSKPTILVEEGKEAPTWEEIENATSSDN